MRTIVLSAMTLMLFFSNSLRAQEVCGCGYEPPVKKLLGEAGPFLAKFNAAKQDVAPELYCDNLYDLMCVPGDFNDGTGVTRLSSTSPTSDHNLLGHVDAPTTGYTDQFQTKLSSAFLDVRSLLLDYIQKSAISPAAKTATLAKVSSINIQKVNCDGDGFKYDDKKNQMHFCENDIPQNMSMFELAFTIAHELSHAFDPCSIALPWNDASGKAKPPIFKYSYPHDVAKSENQFPYAHTISCLRSPFSIKAQKLNIDESFFDSDIVKRNEMRRPGLREALVKQWKLSPFCIEDQITESFADTLAAEIQSRYVMEKLKNLTKKQFFLGYINTFRRPIACKPHPDYEDHVESHPKYKMRVNRILLGNPRVRKQLGCPVSSLAKSCLQ